MDDIPYRQGFADAQAEIARLTRELIEAQATLLRMTNFRDGGLVIQRQLEAENERLNGLHSKALGMLAAQNVRLKDALTNIHGMTQSTGPDWQIVQNVAATAATALSNGEQAVPAKEGQSA